MLADFAGRNSPKKAAAKIQRRGEAQAATLDVSVRRGASSQVARSAGTWYLFDNTGIVIAGEAHHYQIQDWNRVIDVNLRGVIDGVAAVIQYCEQAGTRHNGRHHLRRGITAVHGASELHHVQARRCRTFDILLSSGSGVGGSARQCSLSGAGGNGDCGRWKVWQPAYPGRNPKHTVGRRVIPSRPSGSRQNGASAWPTRQLLWFLAIDTPVVESTASRRPMALACHSTANTFVQRRIPRRIEGRNIIQHGARMPTDPRLEEKLDRSQRAMGRTWSNCRLRVPLQSH